MAQYIGPMDAGVLITDKLNHAVEALDRSLNQIPLDAAKAGVALKAVGGEAEGIGSKSGKARDELGRFTATVRDAGGSAKAAALDLAELDRQITLHKGAIASLQGNTMLFSSGKDQIIQHRAELADLLDLRKKLVAGFGDSGDDSGKSFISRFTNALGSGSNSMVQGLSNIPFAGIIFKPFVAAMQNMPPEAQIAIAGGIATAILAGSAFIGAALNGVLLSAVGLGGIAAGIVGQFQNPIVHDAWATLLTGIVKQFQVATASFAAPLVFSAKIFAAAWDEILPHIQSGFEGLSKFIYPLAAGLANMFRNLTPGLDKAFAAAGPILQQFANELPGLGSALSKFFALLADGGKGAKEGLSALFLIIETLLVGIGGLIDGLSHVWHWFVAAGDAVEGFITRLVGLGDHVGVFDRLAGGGKSAESVAGSLAMMTDATKKATQDFSDLSTKLNTTAITADSLAGTMVGKVFSSMMTVDQATLQWHQSLTTLEDTLKKNGNTLDKHTGLIDQNTAKGQANTSAVLAAVTANMQMYQAQLAAGMSAVDAAKNYDVNTAALEAQLRKAHLTQGEIDGLIGKYRGVPSKVNTEIALLGLTEAINNLANLMADINHIPRRVDVTVTTNYVANRQSVYSSQVPKFNATGAIRTAATGLIVAPSDPGTLIGEPQTGGEALIPLRGVSQSRAMSLAQVVGNNYGFDVSTRGGSTAMLGALVNEVKGLRHDIARQRLGTTTMNVTAPDGGSVPEVVAAVRRELDWGAGV